MSVLHIDLTSLAQGEKTAKGYKFVRRAIVTDPDEQSGRADNAARIFEAINDTGIPDIGDSHPDVANARLVKIKCVAIEPNWLQLDLMYETDNALYQIITIGQEDISMDSSLIQIETTKSWSSGSAVSLAPLTYTYAANDQDPKELMDASGKKVLTGEVVMDSVQPLVPLYVPTRVMRIRKRIKGMSEDELEALNDAYHGAVNNNVWRGYAVRLWLCMGINWSTTDRRNSYDLDIRFQYKFDTFDVEVVWKDPFTGKIPKDVFNQANAYRRDRVQREANFDNLLDAIGV